MTEESKPLRAGQLSLLSLMLTLLGVGISLTLWRAGLVELAIAVVLIPAGYWLLNASDNLVEFGVRTHYRTIAVASTLVGWVIGLTGFLMLLLGGVLMMAVMAGVEMRGFP